MHGHPHFVNDWGRPGWGPQPAFGKVLVGIIFVWPDVGLRARRFSRRDTPTILGRGKRASTCLFSRVDSCPKATMAPSPFTGKWMHLNGRGEPAFFRNLAGGIFRERALNWDWEPSAQVPSLPLTCYRTLGKLLLLSGSQFFHLKNGIIVY